LNNTPTTKELFLSFFRLGLTAFGGPAMVAYVRELAVSQRQWLMVRTMLNKTSRIGLRS
jgi:chromate transporter